MIVTDEMVATFKAAWEAADAEGRSDRSKAGLEAIAASQRVGTFDELDALPDGSFVFHHSVVWKARTAAERYGGYRFWTGAVNDNVATKRTEQMNLPMDVLYRPRA